MNDRTLEEIITWVADNAHIEYKYLWEEKHHNELKELREKARERDLLVTLLETNKGHLDVCYRKLKETEKKLAKCEQYCSTVAETLLELSFANSEWAKLLRDKLELVMRRREKSNEAKPDL